MRSYTKLLTTAAPLALIASMAIASSAQADATVECNTPHPLAPTSTECGVNSTTEDTVLNRIAVRATAIGSEATAIADGSTAVGYNSEAIGEVSTATGASSFASGRSSVPRT